MKLMTSMIMNSGMQNQNHGFLVEGADGSVSISIGKSGSTIPPYLRKNKLPWKK